MDFTPENLRVLAKQIDDMRAEIMFAVDDAGACPFAEQHFLAALDQLNLAYRAMTLAHMSQSFALANNR